MASNATQKRCQACKVDHYCSRDCQSKAWSDGGHQWVCKALSRYDQAEAARVGGAALEEQRLRGEHPAALQTVLALLPIAVVSGSSAGSAGGGGRVGGSSPVATLEAKTSAVRAGAGAVDLLADATGLRAASSQAAADLGLAQTVAVLAQLTDLAVREPAPKVPSASPAASAASARAGAAGKSISQDMENREAGAAASEKKAGAEEAGAAEGRGRADAPALAGLLGKAITNAVSGKSTSWTPRLRSTALGLFRGVRAHSRSRAALELSVSPPHSCPPPPPPPQW